MSILHIPQQLVVCSVVLVDTVHDRPQVLYKLSQVLRRTQLHLLAGATCPVLDDTVEVQRDDGLAAGLHTHIAVGEAEFLSGDHVLQPATAAQTVDCVGHICEERMAFCVFLCHEVGAVLV